MRETPLEAPQHTHVSDEWLLASQSFPEMYREAQEETARLLGGVAIRGLAERPVSQESSPNESTLLSAIQLAALGDPESEKVIQANVATDIAERLFKAAHQTRIKLQMTNGRLEQSGRYMTDIHRNTLEHTTLNAEMLRRTQHELTNAFAFQELHNRGVLTAYDAIVFSPSSTTMSEQEKKDYGFFVETESCSIQYLSADNDQITLESAFVAGKKDPESERHDIAAIQKLTAERDLEVPFDDGTDTIQHIYLVPKSEVQGVEDIVRWYDDAAGGTFYGQAKPRQDYKQYAEDCYERSDDFESMVAQIKGQLIHEAPTFKTPLAAIMRLDRLSAQLCLRRAVHDQTIDEAVFGKRSAREVQDARFFIAQGDQQRAEMALESALEHDESSSCPLFRGVNREGGSGDAAEGDKNGEDKSSWTWKPGICRVEKCPTRPGKTEVGPCEVCRGCQRIFDEGKDPGQVYVPSQKPTTTTVKATGNSAQEFKSLFELVG
jgi:hypothetical protein